jgi:K+-sensing histidine kinase KdpD
MGVDIHSLPGPASVPRVRTERYVGDDNGVRLAEMYEEDAAIVRRTYAFLKDTLAALETGIADSDPLATADALKRMRFLEQTRRFTSKLTTEGYDDERRNMLRQVFHDLRGGALTAAFSRIQLAHMKGSEVEMSDVYGAFFAVRDHLKIMRNCVVDLDTERRERDRQRRTHSTSLLREKWEGYADNDARVEYVSDFDGGLSSSCLEFSTVERAMYNMVNNALAHTADGTVRLFVTALEDGEPENVKIATANAVSDTERIEMERTFGEDLGRLFEGGFTIGGSGIGLSVCARMVTRAYGVESVRRAIEAGYVGAEVRDGEFIAWMHWPVWHD